MNILDALNEEVAAAKERNPSVNIPLVVASYDGDYVIGHHANTGEQIRAKMMEDKNAEKRAYQRHTMQQRSDPRSGSHIQPGGIMMLERAYLQNDGTYDCAWINTITHAPNMGAVSNVYLNISYNEAVNGGKESIRTEFYSKTAGVKVTNIDELKSKLAEALQPKIPNSSVITPTALIRISQPGAKGIVLSTVHAKVHTTEEKGVKIRSIGKPEEAINDLFAQENKTGKILSTLFDRKEVADCNVEVIPGGYSYTPQKTAAKNFAGGKLIEVSKISNNNTEAFVMQNMFNPEVTVGEGKKVRQKLFTDGLLAIATTKPKPGVDPFPFLAYSKQVSGRPVLYELGNIPSQLFNPEQSLTKQSKVSIDETATDGIENSAATDEELGISKDDLTAAAEIDQMMHAAPTPGR